MLNIIKNVFIKLRLVVDLNVFVVLAADANPFNRLLKNPLLLAGMT